jgi:uncharacterized damage-inducible protein DinB
MHLPTQIAKHLRGVYFGGNWTEVNLRDVLADVSWEQATARVGSLNTIATLVYHLGYYVSTQLRVLQGGPLTGHDADSFAHPPITSAADWEAMQTSLWTEVEAAALLIEQLPESQLWETFIAEQYGTYYRNFHGAIEHAHYHLGQIVVVKKLLR